MCSVEKMFVLEAGYRDRVYPPLLKLILEYVRQHIVTVTSTEVMYSNLPVQVTGKPLFAVILHRGRATINANFGFSPFKVSFALPWCVLILEIY